MSEWVLGDSRPVIVVPRFRVFPAEAPDITEQKEKVPIALSEFLTPTICKHH